MPWLRRFSGKWYLEWREGRGQKAPKRCRAVSRNKEIALAALKKLVERTERAHWGLGLGDLTPKEWSQRHLSDLRRRVDSGDLAEASLARTGEVFGHFLGWLKEDHPELRTLSQIDAALLRSYQLARGAVQPGLWSRRARAKTVNTEISLLSPAFRQAVRDGILARNPLEGLHRLKEKDSRPARELSPAQAAKLLQAAGETDAALVPYLVGYLYTGARRSELYAVEWADVDLRRGMLKLQNLKTHRDAGDRWRPIPIHRELDPVLRARRFLPGPWPAIPDQSLRNRFLRLTRAARMPWLTRLHDLRHTFASILISEGADLFTVGKLLGHRDPKTTTRYAHLQREALIRAVAKVKYEKVDRPARPGRSRGSRSGTGP